MRELVTFETEESGSATRGEDDSVLPPGRSIAERLAAGLEAGGLEVSHPPTQWEDYGWEFMVRSGEAGIWCMLQRSDEWLLTTRVRRSVMDRLRGRSFAPEHETVCAVLDGVFDRDQLFRSVRWFTRRDFERGTSGESAS